MKIRFLLVISFFLVCLKGYPQPAETTYLGTLVSQGYVNDASYGPYNIGFNFTFYGISYSEFYINTNGTINFGSGTNQGEESPIPSATLPNSMIAAFWDDLVIDGSGNILYTTIGAAPNRKLIVQFRNMGFLNSPPSKMGTFSIILYETLNKIKIQFRSLIFPFSTVAHGTSATIGIENADGSAGVQYSYHTASVNTWQSIEFTPSGSTYNIDPDADYDGTYLTTNLTLPEPGIPILLSPANEAIIGTSHTFQWSPAQNASTYKLYISTNQYLFGATSYNVGSALSYTIEGLTPGATYAWGVEAINSTGITWCEIRRFTASSIPPLVAVPQTAWAEQGRDTILKLNFTGGDASAKTAIITSLPAQGQLFQHNAGVKGTAITTVPATLTDPDMKLFYAAPASSGNGIGNFNFMIHDANGDSPEALVTVNVSPSGIPNVLYTAKSLNSVEIQFDIIMSDPAGKHGQFGVSVNGTPCSFSAAALKEGDPYTIVLTLTTPLTSLTDAVLVNYMQGNVTSYTGGILMSFSDQNVTLRSQAITFTQSLDKRMDQSPLSLTATSNSGLGLTYSSSNLFVATIAGSTVTLRAVGTSDITARQAGNATYAPAKYKRILTVTKGNQTITFNALPLKQEGDPDFNPGATASSGLTVSYSSSNPSVATIIGGMIHIVNDGTTIITASQPGNSNYFAATSVQQELVVSINTGVEDPVLRKGSFKVYSARRAIYIETIDQNWDGKQGSVMVFDMLGNRICNMQKAWFSTNSNIEISEPFVKGLYIVEIRSGNKRIVSKVIVQE